MPAAEITFDAVGFSPVANPSTASSVPIPLSALTAPSNTFSDRDSSLFLDMIFTNIEYFFDYVMGDR
jgi:hypothetical protein